MILYVWNYISSKQNNITLRTMRSKNDLKMKVNERQEIVRFFKRELKIF